LELPTENARVADMFNSGMLHCTYDHNHKLKIQCINSHILKIYVCDS